MQVFTNVFERERKARLRFGNLSFFAGFCDIMNGGILAHKELMTCVLP